MSRLMAHDFEGPAGVDRLMLPFQLDEVLQNWSDLRPKLVRHVPAEFSRDEWAYLVAFIDPHSLKRLFTDTFGPEVRGFSGVPNRLVRPRGTVAVWLPNNVSLLGPLTMVIGSVTGNRLRLKRGGQSADLATSLRHVIIRDAGPTPLGAVFEQAIAIEYYSRGDERLVALSRDADARVVFGSDAAAAAIAALPHRPDSPFFAFVDKQSEVWLFADQVSDAAIRSVVKVFAVYGKAGCTSPQRIRLIGGSQGDAAALVQRLARVWDDIMPVPQIHVASNTTMSSQLGTAMGWDVQVASRRGACFAAGSLAQSEFEGLFNLVVTPCTFDEALAALPRNIQTLGVSVEPRDLSHLLHRFADTAVKRIVSLERMHHFGPLWDGHEFWRGLFEFVEVSA